MTVYLDHAATSPLRPEAREAWLDASERAGNPSSLHASGRAARSILEESRERIAAALGAHPSEVVFTAGATEALNLGIKGAVWAARDAGGAGTMLAETMPTDTVLTGTMLTGAVEHHAVLDACGWLAAGGAGGSGELRWLGVDEDGRYAPPADAATWDGVSVAAFQWVNNETGVVQPLDALAAAGAERGVTVIGDLVQGIGHLPFRFADSALTAAAVSAHKLGGPVGIGALLVRRDARLVPLLHGGGQERRLRSGTLDAPGAAAFAAALEAAIARMTEESARIGGLASLIADAIAAAAPDATIHAPAGSNGLRHVDAARSQAAPHIVHAIIPGARSESLLLALDRAGIDASPGAACTAGVIEPSHVVLAMGRSQEDAACTLRLSLGWSTTRADADATIAALPGAIATARGEAPRR